MVVKDSSSTTKLRVVLDASSHVRGELSLNEAIHQGPVILPDLVGILLRSRSHKYVVIGDIEKAFHQIRLDESQRDACRIFWLRDHHKPPSPDNIICLRYTRIPFGVNASPFLLAISIILHLEKQSNPISTSIIRNMYVDNLVLGCQNESESNTIYTSTKQIFNDMEMNLREFTANSAVTRNLIEEKDRAKKFIDSKLLGVNWNTETDMICMEINIPIPTIATLRTLLSSYSKLFDPLGLASPFIIKFKILVCELSREKGCWDRIVDTEIIDRWKILRSEVQGTQIVVPRVATTHDPCASQNLVAFADASSKAYGVGIYLVTHYSDNRPSTSHLLMGKSRVNPKTASTIPRLELIALLVATRLVRYVVDELDIQFEKIFIMSDATIALQWIQSNAAKKVFVENRVKEIREITQYLESKKIMVKFSHVRTDQNSADSTTRGISREESTGHIWWQGPEWIKLPDCTWPQSLLHYEITDQDTTAYNQELLPTKIQSLTANTATHEETVPFCRTYSLEKLIRIMAYVKRFILLLKTPKQERSKIPSGLNSVDMEESFTAIVKQHQSEREESLISMETNKFDIIRCQYGIMRCRGRLGNNIPDNNLPILLDPSHQLAHLAVIDHHYRTGHGGLKNTQCSLRRQFWILKGENTLIRKILRECVTCQKLQARPYKEPLPPQLPEHRIQLTFPFQTTGLDYAGPIKITNTDKSYGKCWFCIFTCAATRAIHLELVYDNTTIEFLRALRKFIARRDTPETIICDNAPTFGAGAKALDTFIRNRKRIHESQDIAEFATERRIKWKHITPLAPWRGGFYERLVGMVKSHLSKISGGTTMNPKELDVLLVEIEQIMNNRPLTIPCEVTDPVPITPADLLGSTRISVEVRTEEEPPGTNNRISKIQREATEWLEAVNHKREEFRKRWTTEYMDMLREKNRAEVKSKSWSSVLPNVGDLVLVVDSMLPRKDWEMATITLLYGDENSCIRTAQIRNSKGNILDRAIRHLIPIQPAVV